MSNLSTEELEQVNKMLAERVKELEIQLSLRPPAPAKGEKWFCPRCNEFTDCMSAGRIMMCRRCMREPVRNVATVDMTKELRLSWERQQRVEDLSSQKCTLELKMEDATKAIASLRDASVKSGSELIQQAQIDELVKENESLRAEILRLRTSSGPKPTRVSRTVST
jgi:ribosomal protein S14